jgi:hypothetical protein
LQRIYVSYGLDADSFWRITPREMAARIDGARRRLSSEQDGRAWLSWHIAALSRAEKLPELSEMFETRAAPAPQDVAEQEIALDALFLAWGGDPAQLAMARENRG